MKVKALLFTCIVAAAAFAVQDTVSFARAYKAGDKDKYSMKVNAATQMGAADISMTMNQEVVKVYENGDADIKTTISDMKVLFNGAEMPSGGGNQATTVRVNKLGVPVTKPAAVGSRNPMGNMDQIFGMAAMLGDKPLKVGQPVPINVTDPKDAKSKVTGTMVLESLTGGVAKVNSDVQIYSAQTGDKPTKVKTSAWIDVGSSKPTKVEGSATDLPPMGPVTVDKMTFVMERAK